MNQLRIPARAGRVIPDELRRLQVEASDPAVSAWVAANAGSGKTHVLAQRVIRLLLDGALAPEGALGQALATAITAASDQTFKDVVGEAIRKRDAVRAWIDHGGSIAAAIDALCGTLGVAANDTIERVESEMTEGPLFPASQWPAAAKVLAQGGKSDQEQARRLLAASAASGSERAALYLQGFLTGQ